MPGKTANGSSNKVVSTTPRGEDQYSDSFDSDSQCSPRSPVRKKTVPVRVIKANGRGVAGAGQGRISPRQLDTTARRMISAKGRKIKELLSQIDELERQLTDARQENKTLRRQSFRQEKALDKIDHGHADLPSLITRHAEEVRSLREQMKRYRDKYHSEQRSKKDTESEATNLKRQLVRLKELTEDRHLPERDGLNRRLITLEDELAAKERKIQDLSRKDELLTKNHKSELSAEIIKQKSLQRRIDELEERLSHLENSLKEKEKLLEIQNIYSQRVIRPPHRLDSSASSSATNFQFSTAPHTADATPRDKARQFEERRRNEQKRRMEEKRERQKRQEMSHSDEANGIPEVNEEESATDQQGLNIKTRRRRRRMQRLHSSIRDTEEADEERQRKEREAEEQRLLEEKKRENELTNKLLKKQADDRLKEELLKRKEEERLEQKRQEDKRQDEERLALLEEEEKSRKLREELRIREEKEDQRRRDEEDEARRKQEEEEQEKRRKQFELESAEERRKKDELLAKLRGMEKGKTGEVTSTDISPSKKSYNFTDSIENLHRGKPSNEANIPAYLEQRRRSDNQKDKKLMDELFGGSAGTTGPGKKEVTTQPPDSDSPNQGESKRPSGQLPWEVEDDSSKLLPRRVSQPKAKMTRPAVNAVDEIEDIEELIL